MKATRSSTFSLSEMRKGNKGKMQLIPLRIVLFMMIFLSFATVNKTYGQGVGISELDITPDASSILELRSTLKGFLAPRMSTAQRMTIISPAQGLLVFDTTTQSFWYFDGVWKAITSVSLGSANQLLGMNSTATANEYKTLNPSSNITVTHTAGNIYLNTVQDIQTTSSPTFNALTISSLTTGNATISGLSPNSGVYTNGSSALTTSPPSSGAIGYWSRNAGLLTPSTAGDNISTTGSVTAGSIIKTGGLASEFLKADGSVDASAYITGNQSINFTASGDVAGSASGTTNLFPTLTIEPNAVTTAKIDDGAVTSAKILDGTIADVDISGTAAITGTKINPNFGTQAISTTTTLTAGSIIKDGGLATQFLKADGSVDGSTYITGNDDITFTASGDVTGTATSATNLTPTLTIANNAITSAKIFDGTIVDVDISATAAIAGTKINPNFGAQSISTMGSLAAGNTAISGNITVSGTVDGRDLAQDGTYQDNLQTLTGVAAGSSNLGNFTGSIITDNTTIKSALQDIETSIENIGSFYENYLASNVSLSTTALASVTLEAGTWMITSETTILNNLGVSGTWYAEVVLGTAASLPYTSGQSSATADGTNAVPVAISLSKIVTLTLPTTVVGVFASASVAATAQGGTMTAIHAVRIR